MSGSSERRNTSRVEGRLATAFVPHGREEDWQTLRSLQQHAAHLRNSFGQSGYGEAGHTLPRFPQVADTLAIYGNPLDAKASQRFGGRLRFTRTNLARAPKRNADIPKVELSPDVGWVCMHPPNPVWSAGLAARLAKRGGVRFGPGANKQPYLTRPK